jgi:DNA modification methylase
VAEVPEVFTADASPLEWRADAGELREVFARIKQPMILKSNERWRLVQADCIEHMATLPDACFDFSVFSPPFPSLFSYTDSEADLGNSEDFKGDAKLHLMYFFNQFARMLKPGRAAIVHCQQIPALKRNGEFSTVDLRGILIRLGKRAGLIYESDWPVTKNPQAQAIRTRSTKLQFATLDRDSVNLCPAFNDYLIKFRAPGDNAEPVKSTISRNDWINWAEGVWDWQQISTTDTLNTYEAKGDDDTKHICPLQLGVIRRCVRMYSNHGDTVFSPFAGIGSEGYVSLIEGRRFYGCEIKDEYVAAARKNLAMAESKEREQLGLFTGEENGQETSECVESISG